MGNIITAVSNFITGAPMKKAEAENSAASKELQKTITKLSEDEKAFADLFQILKTGRKNGNVPTNDSP